MLSHSDKLRAQIPGGSNHLVSPLFPRHCLLHPLQLCLLAADSRFNLPLVDVVRGSLKTHSIGVVGSLAFDPRSNPKYQHARYARPCCFGLPTGMLCTGLLGWARGRESHM